MNPTFVYTKEYAKILSGVAILLMVFHHFFGFPHFLKEGIYFISIFDGKHFLEGSNFEKTLAGFCKICVSIYAFNSGYAMWSNQKGFSYPKIPARIIKFLLCYWMISLLFILYAVVAGDVLPTLSTFMYNLFGFKSSYNAYVSNRHSWYVYFYTILLALSPMIIYAFKQSKKFIVDLLIAIAIVKLVVVVYSFMRQDVYVTRVIFNSLKWYLASVFAGILVCKYDIFNLIDAKVGRQKWFVYALVLLAMVVFRIAVPLPPFYSLNLDALLVIILIYCTVCLLEATKAIRAQKALLFLGTYSLNIWFLHAIFHTGTLDFLQKILYYPKFSILVYIWGFMMVVPMAVVVTRMQNAMLKFLRLK